VTCDQNLGLMSKGIGFKKRLSLDNFKESENTFFNHSS